MNDTGVSGGQTQPRIDSVPAIPCTPPPPWVKYDPWPAEGDTSNDAFTDNGVLRLLTDVQSSLLQPGVATYVHSVQKILTRRGAESAAHFALEFDPKHDQLEVHRVRVWRGGDHIDHADSGALQLLRRETQLERLALNGRLTATLLIADLRIEDRLEVAFTVRNRNPVFLDRYAAWLIFNAFAPAVEARQRLLRPSGRKLSFKAFKGPPQAIVEQSSGVEESHWVIAGQERLTGEELLPPWTIKRPCYQITEFADWGEVASLFTPHYHPNELPADIAAKLDEISNRHGGMAERAVEWLRFVQRELRYFALAIGQGGWVPRPLDVIWAGRFGDCKDATRLYVAGARHLGLEVCPALVSTTHGLALGDMLPSPFLFNHVIVRLQIDSTTYWLDPTLQGQGGSLERLVQPHVGWALPLLEGQAQLVRLPEAEPLEHVHCEDSVEFGPDPQSPASLRREYTLAHWTADAMRNRVQNEGVSKLTAQLLQELQATWPQITVTTPLAISDDLEGNRLVVTVSYTIPNCWKRQDTSDRWVFVMADTLVWKELALLANTQRKFPLLLGRPRRVQWHARMQMPCRWRGKGFSNTTNEQGIRFASTFDVEPRQIVLHKELVIERWSLDAEHAAGYAQVVTKLRQNALTIYARVAFGRLRPPLASKAIVFARRWRRLLIFIAALLLIILLNQLNGPH
ncbi:MAG: DUF3857 domain-containing protein [Steroidobacteraceae bacterium]